MAETTIKLPTHVQESGTSENTKYPTSAAHSNLIKPTGAMAVTSACLTPWTNKSWESTLDKLIIASQAKCTGRGNWNAGNANRKVAGIINIHAYKVTVRVDSVRDMDFNNIVAKENINDERIRHVSPRP